MNRANDSEEEMSDNSDDDGYGGYNEYGECDKGYYYRDGRYERRGSPMMSPIIRLGELSHTLVLDYFMSLFFSNHVGGLCKRNFVMWNRSSEMRRRHSVKFLPSLWPFFRTRNTLIYCSRLFLVHYEALECVMHFFTRSFKRYRLTLFFFRT